MLVVVQTSAHARLEAGVQPPVAAILLPGRGKEGAGSSCLATKTTACLCLLRLPCMLCLLCREVYDLLSPGFTGRCTAPLLVDKKARRAV